MSFTECCYTFSRSTPWSSVLNFQNFFKGVVLKPGCEKLWMHLSKGMKAVAFIEHLLSASHFAKYFFVQFKTNYVIQTSTLHIVTLQPDHVGFIHSLLHSHCMAFT